MFKGDAVKEGATAEVNELTATALVHGEEEGAVGGNGDARDVGGGLDREGGGFGLEEVSDGYSVTDG